MAIQAINLGTYANDGTGDDLRTAFQKVNANFAELGTTVGIANGTNIGSGEGVFAQKNLTNLEFKSLTSTDQSVTITALDTTLDLASNARLSSDPDPTLSQDLNINGNRIIDTTGVGDIQTSVHGVNVPILNALVELIVASGSVDINLGSFQQPTGTNGTGTDHGIDLDLGLFALPYSGNTLDFGNFA